MKKLLILAVFAAAFTGCSMGINQSVATIDGKPYLIEKQVRNILWVDSFSEAPKITDLSDLDNASKQEYLKLIWDNCAMSYTDNEKRYNCVKRSISPNK